MVVIQNILRGELPTSIDPVWLSLAPLLAFNVAIMVAFFFFTITYVGRVKNEDVDLKEHSRFLSRHFKEFWYWMTSPVEKLLIKFHVAPNLLTLGGFLISCISSYLFHKGMVGAGGWIMIFGATFDMFDGRIARLTGQASKSGAFFDSVMDRFGEAVVFLGLASYYRSTWVLPYVVLALVGSLMVSYTRARGEGVGVDVKTGVMQRPERIVYLGVGSIFSPIVSYFLSPFLKVPFDFLTVGAILLIAVMTNFTAFYRIRYIIRHLNPVDSGSRPQSRFLARLIHRWNNLGS